MTHERAYREESRASTALVLGILSLMLPILGPFAWSIGLSEIAAIDENRRPPENRSTANAGRILGIISTILLVAVTLFVVVFGLLAIVNRAN